MYQEIVKTLLESLRGNRNCLEMSKFLGHNYNLYFKLESGYKILKFDEFAQIAKQCGYEDLKDVFEKTFNIRFENLSQHEVITAYCKKWGEPSPYVLENGMGFGTSKWWRIKNNKSSLAMIDFFALVENTGCDLFKFLKAFIPEDTLKKRFPDNIAYLANEMSVLEHYPDAALIMCGIYTEEYVQAPVDKKEAVLTRICKIEPTRFKFLFNLLMKNKIIELEEQTSNYIRTHYKTEIRNNNYGATMNQFRFICSEQLKHIENENHDKEKLFYGTKIVALTAEAKVQIRKEMASFYQKISQIVEGDSCKSEKEMTLFQMGFKLLE